MKKILLGLTCAAAFAMPAHALIITIDPDNYVLRPEKKTETPDISSVVPEATLSVIFPGGVVDDIYAVRNYGASTGLQVFGYRETPTTFDSKFSLSAVFHVVFNVPVKSFSIDFISADTIHDHRGVVDVNDDNNLDLARIDTGVVSGMGVFQTITYSYNSPTDYIGDFFVTANPHGNFWLDNLVFETADLTGNGTQGQIAEPSLAALMGLGLMTTSLLARRKHR